MINYKLIINVLFVCLIIFETGCLRNEGRVKSPKNEQAIPQQIADLENLTILSPKTNTPDTVELIKQTVFESNNEIMWNGYIEEVVVDKQNNVYIVVAKPGAVGVYVFEPDGSYKARFAHEGRGPGEYESISSLDILDNYIYLLDSRLQKFGVFSLKDYSHVNDEIINREKITQQDTLATRLNAHQLFAVDNGLLLGLRNLFGNRVNPRRIFCRLSTDGTLLPKIVLNVRRFSFYHPRDRDPTPILMSFARSSLISVTKDGNFFTAWTENFLIKEYDAEGQYQRAFYYPVENSSLSMDELTIGERERKALTHYEIPETWPALHTMELDDEGRLWVASITDSDSTYLWRVIDQQGEILARFSRPGFRSWRPVISKPLIVIKNGYFYSHERNFEMGIDRIIKYKIVFKQR